MTLVELLVVMVVIGVLAVFFMGLPIGHSKARAIRVYCINNQKQIGLATRVWASDHGDKYPASISETNGGTMEFVGGTDEWRHFLVMSNELSTPKILLCPSDERTLYATNFTFLRNSNISFFLGVDVADGSNPQMILGGDRNLTNGTPIKNGILQVSSNNPAGWTSDMHNKVGNILLADGSVQQVSMTGLRSAIENATNGTSRLQMPVLGP
jgi:prepilin-type N-terminal cleavage/methylation domain-containing protein/prepilin-type processing-associated H-X9-DG protein